MSRGAGGKEDLDVQDEEEEELTHRFCQSPINLRQ